MKFTRDFDLEECVIERRIIRRDLAVIASMLERSSMEYSEKDFIRMLNCPHHEKMMLRYRNRSIGFLIAQVDTPLRFVLRYLVIDPSTRRHGAGRMLMNELIQIARDEDRRVITLETPTKNMGAVAFASSMDFKKLGPFPSNFDNRTDQVFLMKRIVQEA